jgi:ubiquitin carboxyl-terminal hydrolase 7
MIFLKHFDATQQKLSGIGKVHMPKESGVSDLVEVINEKMGWASGTTLRVYEVTIGRSLPILTC